MRIRAVSWMLGGVLAVISTAAVPPGILALALGEPWLPFAGTAGFGGLAAAAGLLYARAGDRALDYRSAFLAVTLAFVLASAFGAVPLLAHPGLALSPVDALFESTSGFTTTGATVLSGLDSLPRSVLLWRALLQWFGGMATVLLGIAVLPILGVGGMQVLRAEVPGPTKDQLSPRISETARALWALYLGLSAACALLYYFAGLGTFDAICHALTTVSTGGFGTHDASLGHFDSFYVRGVATVVMLFGGVSFALLHRALSGGLGWVDQPELRLYLGLFVVASVLIGLDLGYSAPDVFPGFASRADIATFQAASMLTGTGFRAGGSELWPALSHTVFLMAILIGGMAGSTSGGFKVVRVLLASRLAVAQFFRLVHPRGYASFKLASETVDASVTLAVVGLLAMWFALVFAGTALLTAFGFELWHAFSASVTALSNAGGGLSELAPGETWIAIGAGPKATAMALMLLGRLEIYTALVLLAPGFWRR